MKNKITILIISSILMLIALSSIQAYLIHNTYQLKKEGFIKETQEALEGLHRDKNALDSIQDVWKEDLRNHLNDYKNQRLTKTEVLRLLKIKTDSLQPRHGALYQEGLKRIGLDYDVIYKKSLKYIAIFDTQTDTIYNSKNETQLRLFGQDFKDENENRVNVSTWFTESEYIHQVDGEIKTDTYDLEVQTESYILITDWKRIVYGRMAALFIGSVILFLFVIGLLYYSIKNLVTQKKIADIKTDFINNITHELKTPLATLGIATKSLKTEKIKNKPDAFNNTLSIVERQNNRLQKLIDQVMTNSLSSEDIVLNKEHVSDNEFFKHLIEDFKLSTQHHDLTIENDIYPSEVLLRIDKFHFTTAFLNILENAVKYGKDQTEINIHSKLKNGNYIVEITDNGIGISEKNQHHIFDKFYRVSDGNIHDVKGLGLGMYYTSQIINAHNGSIAIDSELNKGTTFTIKIPIKLMERIRILLAEDDFDFGSILKQYLEVHDFHVTWTKDGKDALDTFKKASENDTPFNICVFDVMMPKMDGFALAEHIVNLDPEVPFVFLTAKKMKEDRIIGLKLGADDYIVKPFEADILVLRLKNILKRTQKIATHQSKNESSYRIGRYVFNPINHQLKLNETVQTLTVKEAQLIAYFFEHKNQMIKRDDLLTTIWGSDDFFSGRSMDVFISKLRKYFKQDSNISIESTRGVGLTFKIEQ